MTDSIHGHEVIEMMMASGQDYTKESLEQAIIARFGEQSRFHTCSAENMTPQEMVVFLESRGKFLHSAKGFNIDPKKVCDHQ